MSHRIAVDCDWCGAKDIPKEQHVHVGVWRSGAKMATPIGVSIEIEADLHPLTWIEVCDECAEKAEAAIRVWAREDSACRVATRAPWKTSE